jgi:hypothetical protein
MQSFLEEQVPLIHDLADSKQRLLVLTHRYAAAKRKPINAVPHPLANLASETAHTS